MLNLAGYSLTEKIYQGQKTVIYRGYKHPERQPVIVKSLAAELPHPLDIASFKHQYEILNNLDVPGVVKLLGLERYRNSFVLIMEDFGGQSLTDFMKDKKISLKAFLQIGIQVAEILGKLHKKGIIHKDIKPQNILINPSTDQIKITDFSISSRLDKETHAIAHANALEGTFAYISPEQTGRMNRSLDYRTDFYSLGVTFYEILTGELPFKSTDPMELLHCHIARLPVPPCEQNPLIPPVVSSIVMKLLSKTAEERFQTAGGLKADLEECLFQLQTTGKIDNFSLGGRDLSSQLLIPQKLYGREREVQTLMDAFDRIAGLQEKEINTGTTELMLVSGYSGIGKTSVVNEIHKPIVGAHGYFIAGKFDQYKKNIPYAAIIQAFQSLMEQILTESPEKLAVWKASLLAALGENGQLIIDVIPEVELIIGKQQDVPQLGLSESQNRFNRLFKELINVLATKNHPLVLFLDDLQWADSASLNLIQLLLCDPDSKYLLMIGAYRDNEVTPTHPFIKTLENIQQSGATVNQIVLQPLDLSHVNQLVSDTLKNSKQSQMLAQLLFNKTRGNPFFLTQLFQTLHSEELLIFDFNTGGWRWDYEEIQAIGITDCNVVELVARNLNKLPQATQTALKLAACIGNSFNLDTLSVINEESISITAAQLWPALQAGLLLPLSQNYKIPLLFLPEELNAIPLRDSKVDCKFLHDRVQQAAYSFIPESEKKVTHFKIGQLLLKNTTPEERKENVFALVNQLNFGTDLLTNQAEKDELAGLNLIAGQKALAATAYEAAVKYLNLGIELLAADSWQNQYELTLALYVKAVEAEYLNINFERSEQLASVVLLHAVNLLDKVKVYELNIQSYVAQNQLIKAVDTGIFVVEMLGVSLAHADAGTGIVELPTLKEIEQFPEMKDPDKLAALKLLITISGPASYGKPELFLPIVLTQLNLCLQHGHSALAAYVYSIYGLLLCAALGNLDAGYHSGQLALKLLERFCAKELKAKVYTLFNVTTRHWKKLARETIAPLQEGVQSGLETGDLEYAGYCALNCCAHVFLVGEYLESVEKVQSEYLALLIKLKQEFQINYVKIWRQLALNLSGNVIDKYRLLGESFNETEMLPHLEQANNRLSIFVTYLAKTILCYLFKDYAAAIENAAIAEKDSISAPGHMTVAVHNFYYSLALLAQYPNLEASNQEKCLSMVESNQEKLKIWALSAPSNYQHKYELVEAEKARILGKNWEAMEHYDQAIAGAKKFSYIQEEALAYERAAEFYLAAGREEIGQTYIKSAYYGYVHWGAQTKVEDLESQYPQIVARIFASKIAGVEDNITTTSTTAGAGEVLDFAAVVKATTALSGEIVIDNLLKKLMKITLENAGAQKGYLILENNGELVIEASGEMGKDETILLPSVPVSAFQNLPISLLNYVKVTRKPVVLNNAASEGIFTKDAYIIKTQPKSVLTMAIANQGKFIGLVYLENNLAAGAFTPQRLEVLKLLASGAAISLENARLYAHLESANQRLEEYSQTLEVKVQERTLELQEKNERLQQTFKELQRTQSQLIQTEKMSSLGHLVAGIAHEINNPINFIYGNLSYATEYTQQMLKLLTLYHQTYPRATPEIEAEIETIDFNFIKEDQPKLLESMKGGAERIRQIVLSLRNFSRLDESSMKPVDIHEGLESTLLILQNRLRIAAGQTTISVSKEYGNLPQVECYAGELNQVFMNILNNAIDALEERFGHYVNSEVTDFLPTPYIRIRTEVTTGNCITIRVADNGAGMSEEVRKRIFDPFFTTKPVGSGTGLGLSVSYQIVVEKHGGVLKCVSTPTEGTELIIKIPQKQPRRHQHCFSSNTANNTIN
ncbi:MAG: AAA family ATPase [Microcoleus vaginatus WJT46-NPBG5]|jgi:predicted ATPase/signal transduction histidine kinase|nr:AAA family ATPase [Microcoleus vaginatus WJT46-NPBG5]